MPVIIKSRIDAGLKAEVEQVLSYLGLSTRDLIQG